MFLQATGGKITMTTDSVMDEGLSEQHCVSLTSIIYELCVFV